jgi:hypothetical protein
MFSNEEVHDTKVTKDILFSEANSRSGFPTSMKPEVHYGSQNCPPLFFIVDYINSGHRFN